MDHLLVMKTVANILPGRIKGRYVLLLLQIDLVAYINFTDPSYYKIIQ